MSKEDTDFQAVWSMVGSSLTTSIVLKFVFVKDMPIAALFMVLPVLIVALWIIYYVVQGVRRGDWRILTAVVISLVFVGVSFVSCFLPEVSWGISQKITSVSSIGNFLSPIII